MRLSPRRFAFLETLLRMSGDAGRPVHYADVGREMGVSRWTAYDMMRELAKDGLVSPVYVRSEHGYPGRSQVLFAATEKGAELVRSRSASPDLGEEWSSGTRAIVQKMIVALAQRRGFEFFRSEMSSSSPALFCAALVAGLVAESRRRGLDLMLAARLLNFSELETAPLLFVGFIAGGLILRDVALTVRGLRPAVERFADEITSLKDEERQALTGFVKEVLGKATST